MARQPRSAFGPIPADRHRDDVATTALAEKGDRLLTDASVQAFGQRSDLLIRRSGSVRVPWAVAPNSVHSPLTTRCAIQSRELKRGPSAERGISGSDR